MPFIRALFQFPNLNPYSRAEAKSDSRRFAGISPYVFRYAMVGGYMRFPQYAWAKEECAAKVGLSFVRLLQTAMAASNCRARKVGISDLPVDDRGKTGRDKASRFGVPATMGWMRTSNNRRVPVKTMPVLPRGAVIGSRREVMVDGAQLQI
jgi:hypothetical protein